MRAFPSAFEPMSSRLPLLLTVFLTFVRQVGLPSAKGRRRDAVRRCPFPRPPLPRARAACCMSQPRRPSLLLQARRSHRQPPHLPLLAGFPRGDVFSRQVRPPAPARVRCSPCPPCAPARTLSPSHAIEPLHFPEADPGLLRMCSICRTIVPEPCRSGSTARRAASGWRGRWVGQAAHSAEAAHVDVGNLTLIYVYLCNSRALSIPFVHRKGREGLRPSRRPSV